MLKTAQIPIPKGKIRDDDDMPIPIPKGKIRDDEDDNPIPTPKKGLPPGAVPVESLPHAPVYHAKSNPEVAQMQQSIIDLSKTISQHDIFSKTPKSNANDMLGNFFANKYLQTTLDKLGQKGTVDLKNFANYLGSIGAGAANKADGQWGPKTQHSLKQTVAFAEAFLTLSQELGVDVGYNLKNLASLKEFIPQDDKSGRPTLSADTDKVAKEINEHLQLINSAYKTFEKEVLDNSEYSQALGGKSSLIKSQPKTIDQSSLAYATSNPRQAIISLQNAKAPLTFNDILNINNFRQYLGTNTSVNVADSKAVSDEIDSIEQKIKVHNNPDGF